MHEMENGSILLEVCACGDQNVEPVISMSVGLFCCCVLHFISHL